MNTETLLLQRTAERDEARQLVVDIVRAIETMKFGDDLIDRVDDAVQRWRSAPTEPPAAPEEDEPRMAGEFGEAVFSSGSVSPLSRAEELNALWPLAPVAMTGKAREETMPAKETDK